MSRATISDDLAFYRDYLGLVNGNLALPMLSDACAWLDEQQQLVITVRGVEFTSHVPVTDQFAATIGCEGVVHLIVVSGVPIRADQSLHMADLHTPQSKDISSGAWPNSARHQTADLTNRCPRYSRRHRLKFRDNPAWPGDGAVGADR